MKVTGLDKMKAMLGAKKMPAKKPAPMAEEAAEGDTAMDSPAEELAEPAPMPKKPAAKKGIKSIADLRAALKAKKL